MLQFHHHSCVCNHLYHAVFCSRGSWFLVKKIKKYHSMPWHDGKVHSFVCMCGTALAGDPAKKKRYDNNLKLYFKKVELPKLVAMYHDGAPSIDVHSHLRQDGLALEQVWCARMVMYTGLYAFMSGDRAALICML